MRQFSDPIERTVYEALTRAGVRVEAPHHGSDFILQDYGIEIECKAYFTERIIRQMNGKKIIVIQSREAAEAFAKLISTHEITLEE